MNPHLIALAACLVQWRSDLLLVTQSLQTTTKEKAVHG
jgi:hypothetical protein